MGGIKKTYGVFCFLAMHNYASLRGKELANFLSTAGCESLLDLGCGPGTYAFHLGMRNPRLKLYLLDHPVVLEAAKEIQARYSLEERNSLLASGCAEG